MIAHSHDDLLFFCLLSAAFLAFPKKPPRVSPQGVAPEAFPEARARTTQATRKG